MQGVLRIWPARSNCGAGRVCEVGSRFAEAGVQAALDLVDQDVAAPPGFDGVPVVPEADVCVGGFSRRAMLNTRLFLQAALAKLVRLAKPQ